MFKKVLFPIDIQEGEIHEVLATRVLDCAAGWGASLYLVYVLPGFGSPMVASFFPEGAEEQAIENAKKLVHDFIAEHMPKGADIHAIVCAGKPYEEILREASELDIDLIIVPSHNRQGLERWLLGSTASKVVDHAECSVMVLRHH
jgi:nucleotide-binding universal stress UspA family protein